MATPVPAPTPTPAPTPAPATPPSPWSDPATWLHLAAVLLAGLLATGVIPTTGTAAQVAAMIAAVLTALGYPVVRAVIERARAAVALPPDTVPYQALMASMQAHNELARATIQALFAARGTAPAGTPGGEK